MLPLFGAEFSFFRVRTISDDKCLFFFAFYSIFARYTIARISMIDFQYYEQPPTAQRVCNGCGFWLAITVRALPSAIVATAHYYCHYSLTCLVPFCAKPIYDKTFPPKQNQKKNTKIIMKIGFRSVTTAHNKFSNLKLLYFSAFALKSARTERRN